jgi:Flp pilus assembly protein TadD
MWERQLNTGRVIAAALVCSGIVACDGGKKETRGVMAETTPSLTPASHVTTVPESTVPVRTVTGPLSFKDGETAFAEKRYDEAVTVFKGYTTQKPENPWGHYMLGLAAWKSRDLDQAEGEFLKAIELAPTHVKSMYNLGRVYLDKGEPQKAVEQIESALKFDSTSSEGFRLLGRAREESGLLVEAEQAYRQSLTLDGKDAWSMNNLGLNFIKQDRAQEAIGVLARAVELKPENVQFQNNLGMALELNGYFVKAAEVYGKATEIDSTYQKAIDNLARVSVLKDKPGIPEIKLEEQAQNFATEIEGSTVVTN